LEATIWLIVGLPRSWDRPIADAYVNLEVWQHLDQWKSLHPKLSKPLGLRYIGPAAPELVQAVAGLDPAAPELPDCGGTLPWRRPQSIPFSSRAELDTHRVMCAECRAGTGFAGHPHGAAPVWASYREGVLLLTCTECETPLVAVTVE
jgi:hypothetical protein